MRFFQSKIYRCCLPNPLFHSLGWLCPPPMLDFVCLKVIYCDDDWNLVSFVFFSFPRVREALSQSQLFHSLLVYKYSEKDVVSRPNLFFSHCLLVIHFLKTITRYFVFRSFVSLSKSKDRLSACFPRTSDWANSPIILPRQIFVFSPNPKFFSAEKVPSAWWCETAWWHPRELAVF